MANIPVSLKALAESKSDGIQKLTAFKVRPDVIIFEPGFNLRDEGPELDAHIDQLEVAMRAGAYIPPIDVSVIDGKIIAREGHCRTRAARRIEGYMLEARQLRGNEADAIFHMLGSDQRLNFSPVQVARGYLRLVNMGQDVSAIATRLGLHRSTIENALTLAAAPVAVQSMVTAGTVSASLAVKTVRKEGTKAPDKLKQALDAAQASGKAKVTAKHVEPKQPANAFVEFVKTVATMNPLVTPRREEIAGLIAEANKLLGRV